MGNVPFRFIQLSDTHLFADPTQELLSVNTEKSLTAVLDLIKQKERDINFILHSGDMTQDSSETAYLHIVDKLKSFAIPTYYTPGNHDNVKTMAQVYPRETISNHRCIVLKNWILILLNSQLPHAMKGFLDQAELNYMEHCLQTYPEHHALIAFHHHPVPVGSLWLDNLCIENAKDFWQVVKHYPKVNTVLFGHVHQEFSRVVEGVKCFAVPSTCFQFMPKQDKFSLENLPPGYRWVNLYEDGHIETGVERTPTYIGKFSVAAKGY